MRDNMNIIMMKNYNIVDITMLEENSIHLFINGWMAELFDSKEIIIVSTSKLYCANIYIYYM